MTQGINWNNGNPFSNLHYNYIPQIPVPAPHREIDHVNGENGVDAFQMGPNCSALLLDETAPLVWLVYTDSAGYKTKTAYDISLHVEEPKPDIKSMEEQLATIDKRLQAIEEAMNDESDS